MGPGGHLWEVPGGQWDPRLESRARDVTVGDISLQVLETACTRERKAKDIPRGTQCWRAGQGGEANRLKNSLTVLC